MNYANSTRTVRAYDYAEAFIATSDKPPVTVFCQVYGCPELCDASGLCPLHARQKAEGVALQISGPLPGQFSNVQADEWTREDGSSMTPAEIARAKANRKKKRFEKGV